MNWFYRHIVSISKKNFLNIANRYKRKTLAKDLLSEEYSDRDATEYACALHKVNEAKLEKGKLFPNSFTTVSYISLIQCECDGKQITNTFCVTI